MPDSKSKIIKDGWGSRLNFQLSYGLKMTPEDIEEGNRILEAFQEDDKKAEEEAAKASDAKGKEAGNGNQNQSYRSSRECRESFEGGLTDGSANLICSQKEPCAVRAFAEECGLRRHSFF